MDNLETMDNLHKKVMYFDEEIYRLLAMIPIHYSEEELKQRIPNWDYFENKMETLANSKVVCCQK